MSSTTPETLQPIYEESLLNRQKRLTDVPNRAVQKEFLINFVSSFEKHFEKFDWLLSDTEWSSVDQVTAHTIGLALEHHLTEKHGDGYHTPPELTNSVAKEAISDAILEKLNSAIEDTYTDFSEVLGRSIESLSSAKFSDRSDSVVEQDIATKLSHEIIPELRVSDLATGSGMFLLSALDTIEPVIESVTCEAAGFGNCVQQLQRPAKRSFGQRVLECSGYRDGSAV